MQLEGKDILIRIKNKNRGNVKLWKAIERLIEILEKAEIGSPEEFKILRTDAEKVHNKGFYFLDIISYRALVLLLADKKRVTILWAGNHQEYERIFKNNKNTIEKWLKNNKFLQ